MVTVAQRKNGIGNAMEKYQLDLAGMKSENILIGVAICWLIATDGDVRFKSLYGEGDSDDMDISPEYISLGRFGNGDMLSDISAFSKQFIEKGITKWRLTCLVHGIEIVFYGHSYGTIVGISMPEDADVDVMPILQRAERMTHNCG